ncbi:MAG: lipocalin family protein [Fluviicola sp.]
MKKSTFLKAFGLLSLLFVFAACSKYEEGSNFTILTKKARMVNEWTLISYTVNGNAQTLNGTTTWDLKKDGQAVITASSGGFSFSDTGTWDFNSDKTKLVITDSNGDIEEYTIIQLKNKDLKLQQTDDNDNVYVATYTGE